MSKKRKLSWHKEKKSNRPWGENFDLRKTPKDIDDFNQFMFREKGGRRENETG